jgi:hypothetical protein
MAPSVAVTYVAPRTARVRPAGAHGRSRSARRTWLVPAILLLAGALISGFTILQGIDPFDEGLVLQAARRVAAGQVPYRDFSWAYGPAQPYLLAGLFKIFGVSLLDWRVLRALADGAVAMTAYLLVSPRVPSPLALLTWLAVACEMAEPRNANPFPFALLALLLALWLTTRADSPGEDQRALIGAALLTAVAAAFRIDFTIYGGAAILVVIAIRSGIRPALAYFAIAVGLSALIYLPFAIIDGPGSLYHALIAVSLQTGAYWSLPFPLHYHAPPGAGIGKTVKHAIDFYVPLLVIVGFGVMTLSTASQTWRQRRLPALQTGLVVFGAGLLAYLLSRTDDIHTQPLFVIVTIGLALTVSETRLPVAAACTALLTILLIHGAANRLSALRSPPAEVPLNVPVADGVLVAPREAKAIDQMVKLVDRYVLPDAPIYVLPRRSDLVTYGDPLIYVLTERANPTSADFGLFTGAAAQASIVRSLERVHPRILVRWTDPMSSSPEPNLRGRSSGVHTVDDWVAVHYRPLARLYHYEVLIARG